MIIDRFIARRPHECRKLWQEKLKECNTHQFSNGKKTDAERNTSLPHNVPFNSSTQGHREHLIIMSIKSPLSNLRFTLLSRHMSMASPTADQDPATEPAPTGTASLAWNREDELCSLLGIRFLFRCPRGRPEGATSVGGDKVCPLQEKSMPVA